MPAPAELRQFLSDTLQDLLLSRSEKQALSAYLQEWTTSPQDLATVRNAVFELAQAEIADGKSRAVLKWVEELMRLLLTSARPEPERLPPEAHFSPGDDCVRRLTSLMAYTKRNLDVCVFTITDDRLCEGLLAAQARGVQLRIITDNEKAFDPGSDVIRLQQAGVPVRVDQSPFHMHHKFALFDREILVTGSYNWTRGAARDNEENFIITTEQRLLDPYEQVFEKLWNSLG